MAGMAVLYKYTRENHEDACDSSCNSNALQRVVEYVFIAIFV
jgi:hypothetical protein